MNLQTAEAIVLNRINFGESDRIISVITAKSGKLRLLVKGARKEKSKLAGGVEIFSVCHITYIKGRGEINTLTSARLIKHFGNIVHNLDRTLTGYEIMKQLNRITEDSTEEEYFNLLKISLNALDDDRIELSIIKGWFDMQVIKLNGQSPNLKTDSKGVELPRSSQFVFNFENMAFDVSEAGKYTPDHIKVLRLGFSTEQPLTLQQIKGIKKLWEEVTPITETIYKSRIQL